MHISLYFVDALELAKKKSVLMENEIVSFSLYSFGQHRGTIGKGNVVLITGLAKNYNKSTFKMYFSKEKRSGGEIENIVNIDEPGGSAALIYFKDSNGKTVRS